MSIRPFFCALRSIGSGAFRLAVGSCTGCGSSSSESVKSMTAPEEVAGIAELPAEDFPGIETPFEGESSFLTLNISSLSESESSMKTSPGSVLTLISFEGDALVWGLELISALVGIFCAGFPCSSIHFCDPYLLSTVCHSPLGSNSTSSTLSGVDCTMDWKKLLRGLACRL